jgi:hypothetical protein
MDRMGGVAVGVVAISNFVSASSAVLLQGKEGIFGSILGKKKRLVAQLWVVLILYFLSQANLFLAEVTHAFTY